LRRQLGHQLGRSYASGREQFTWGVSWAGFDEKAFTATAGLHYEPQEAEELPATSVPRN
jgi:hypothetical protein